MSRHETVRTERQSLIRPRQDDVREIIERFATDPEVTRYVSWPRHESVESTHAFIDMSDEEWSRWGVGPYLVRAEEGQLIGSTGLHWESAYRASTGYVFARDAWGLGTQRNRCARWSSWPKRSV